jgi:hypothetical protein
VFIAVTVLLGTSCSAPVSPRPVTPPAVVVIENHTGYDWRVAFTPTTPLPAERPGPEPRWIDVAPRATRRMELVAGTYRVQRALVAEAAPRADPGVELILEAGRTYPWPLGTLLSAEGVEP